MLIQGSSCSGVLSLYSHKHTNYLQECCRIYTRILHYLYIRVCEIIIVAVVQFEEAAAKEITFHQLIVS